MYSNSQKIVNARRKRILELIREKKYVSILQLQKILFISEATIRRDLLELDKLSLIKKIPGGAISIAENNYEQPLNYKTKENLAQKKFIAKIAYGLVSEHQTIFLDSSSTTYILARELVRINHLRILSNSIYTASLLSTNPTIEAYCPPGKIAHKLGTIFNYQTSLYIKQHHADIAFLSCRGFDPNFGASDYLEYEAEIKRCYVENAHKIILLIDSSKWNKNFFFQSIPLEKISVIISDKAPSEDICTILNKKNIPLLTDL